MVAVGPHLVALRLFGVGEGIGAGESGVGETTRAGAGVESPGMGAKETLLGLCWGSVLGGLGCFSAARALSAVGSL